MEAIKVSNRYTHSWCVSLASPLLFQPATSWVLCDINSLSRTLGQPWSERLCPPDHEDWSLWNHKPNGSSLKSLLSEASELGCSRAERLGMTPQSRVPGINLISAGCSVGQSYTVGSCYCRTREMIRENPGNGDSSGLNRTSPPSAAQGTLQTAGRVWGRERDAEHHLPGTPVLSFGTHSSCEYLSNPTQLGPSILCDGRAGWLPVPTLLLQDLQAVNGWWRR